MDNVHDGHFLVFLRTNLSGEQPLASCATFADARRIRQALKRSAPGPLVIRFVGPTGGGD
jgi:hypothetical protein